MEAIYSGELISKLENGPVGQAGGEKRPLKSPWGAGVGVSRRAERSRPSLWWLPRSRRARAPRSPSPLHSEALGPEAKRRVTEG